MLFSILASTLIILCPKSVSITPKSIIEVKAKSSVINQTFSIQVDQLASNELWQLSHTGIDDAVTTLGGEFIVYVRGITHFLKVPAGTTLKELAQIINELNIGVTATVYDVGAGEALPARLSITDNFVGKYDVDQASAFTNIRFGENGDQSLSALNPVGIHLRDGDLGTPGFQPIVEGKDAKIYLNHDLAEPIYRDSNLMKGLIAGLRIRLLQAAPEVWVTVTIQDHEDGAYCK